MYGDKEIQTVESLIVAVSQIHLGLPLIDHNRLHPHFILEDFKKEKKPHSHSHTEQIS